MATPDSFITITYVLAAAIWVIGWIFCFGACQCTRTKAAWVGFVFTLVLLGYNAYVAAREERQLDTASELEELNRQERNAFYVAASIFSLGSLLVASNRGKSVEMVMPLLMGVMLTVICVTMAPVWLTDPAKMIRLKHVRGALVCMGMGFLVSALMVISVH